MFEDAKDAEIVNGASTVHWIAAKPPTSNNNGAPNGSYMQGLYGTQKQTVILVGHDGRVKYFERTLYEDDARATEIHKRDQSFEFVIEK